MGQQLDKLDSQLLVNDANEFRRLISDSKWRFSIVPGTFQQSLDQTDDMKFDYIKENFGLVGNWTDLKARVDLMNNEASGNVFYKVFFLARHGQGYHNLAHETYGNDAWNDYWSKLNGDGKIVWGPDPELTDLGIDQAKGNNKAWKEQIEKGAILPTKFYVSPLSRSIDTMLYTWQDIVEISEEAPLIKENIRETTGVHTCDKRLTKLELEKKYGKLGLIFEDGFEEEDIYYDPEVRETVPHQAKRVFESFVEIFESTDRKDSFVSVTSHSGTIRASLLALGHREFMIGTGGMIPVFVKAEKTE